MKRHRLALLFLALFAIGLLVAFFWLPVLSRTAKGLMLAELSRRLDAQISVSGFGLSLIPPRVRMEGLEIKKEKGPVRYIGVGSATIEPGVGPIFLGRISIRRIEVENPLLRIDLTDQTPVKPLRGKRLIRIPTLNDLIRIRVDEIRVRGVSLALRLPGEDVRVEIGSGAASYEGGLGAERWSWKGSGKIFRGSRELHLDQITIVAEREGQYVALKQFDVSGLGATVSLKGDAYPEADLFLQVRGRLEPIEKSARELGILSRSLGLGGWVGAEGRVKGAWDSLAWSGEFRGNDLTALQRRISRLAFSFRMNRRTVEAASGEADFGGPVVRFSVSSMSAGQPGKFELRAAEIPFPEIQRLIDPDSVAKLRGLVSLSAHGNIGFKPWVLDGAYAITSPELFLFISEVMHPYLPLSFRNLSVRGKIGWSGTRNLFIENGTIQMDGVDGTYGFEFPKGANVKGTWNVDISDVSEIFPSGDPVEGSGRITGGLEAGRGFHQVLLRLHLEPFRYLSHPEAQVDGDVLIEKGGTRLRNFRFRAEKGLVRVEGRIPNEPTHPIAFQGTFSDFDLGWISDVAARRFPLWGGVEGIGTGSISLSGEAAEPTGTIRLESRQAAWRGERFDHVDALLDLERGEVIVQKARVSGSGLSADVRGVVGHEQFRDFQIDAKRFPLSIVSFPSFLFPLVSHADVHLKLQGTTENPRTQVDLRFVRLDKDRKSVGVGRGNAEGEASDLAWSVELESGAFRARGRVDAQKGNSFEGNGAFKRFPLTLLIPATGAFLTADWTLKSHPRLRKSWNGEAVVRGFDVEQGEWKLSLAAPATVKIQDGSIRLEPAFFTGSSSALNVEGRVGSDNGLSGRATGKIAMRALTLFPLNLTRAEGEAEIEAKLGGKVEAPQFTGRLEIRDGLLQFKGFPHPIEALSATASLEQKRIFFDRMTASVAGGKAKASGELLLGGPSSRAKVMLNGEVDHVNLRFPNWIPATMSGTLSLTGPISRPLFRGDLLVHEARYQDNWDWQSKILTFRRTARAARVHRADEEKIRFDLFFRSEGDTFLLKNSIASATMRGDLRLVGSDLGLGLLGKVEVLEGKVVFLDNQFQLSPGLVTFDREDSIHMSLDLNGKTRVQTTDIFLDIRTEKENVVAFLSSQPVKDETSLIALLTLGVDTEELVGSKASDQNLSSSVVPTVLSGAVQSRLESGLKKTRFVDTFQFVPYFSEDTKTTGLKMVVGKELFPRVRLLYSTDLFDAGAENTVKLEQRFSDHVSLQGSVRDNKQQTTNQEYDLGLDFEFKFEF